MKKVLILFLLLSLPVFACSIFQKTINNQIIVGKNFDWKSGDGEIFIRPKGARKKALETNLSWTSLYNSIYFSQMGPDLPIGGVNEKGLVVEALWLQPTRYALSNQNLSELEWIQYQLDTKKTTSEVLESLNDIGVKGIYARVHYFICDQTNDCAIVEFKDRNILIHRGDQLPHRILTNNYYEESIDLLGEQLNFDQMMLAGGSLLRFQKLFKSYKEETDPRKILAPVKLEYSTQWQMMYNLTNNSVHFLHTQSNQKYLFQFSEIDFSCNELIKGIKLYPKETLQSQIFKRSIGKLKSNKLLLRIKERLGQYKFDQERKDKILQNLSLKNNCI